MLSPSLSLNTLVNIHYCMQRDVTAQRFGLTSDPWKPNFKLFPLNFDQASQTTWRRCCPAKVFVTLSPGCNDFSAKLLLMPMVWRNSCCRHDGSCCRCACCVCAGALVGFDKVPLDFGRSVARKRIRFKIWSNKDVKWGSEIWTSLDLEWLKRGWVSNGPD